ncbi:hypothetical protein P5704_024200 (plasmid) [Pseudomonas sp. FeN3W]|nr:hypothetical protein P5704_024200 [Pseudomonas sp. FeN3W]
MSNAENNQSRNRSEIVESRAYSGIDINLIDELPTLTRTKSCEYFLRIYGEGEDILPIKDWSDELIIEAAYEEPRIIRIFDICLNGRLTQEIADRAFIANIQCLEFIPHSLVRREFMIAAAMETPSVFLKMSILLNHRNRKGLFEADAEFWSECLQASGYSSSVFFSIPDDMQTEDQVLEFMNAGYLSMRTSYVPHHALTDKVLAAILKTKLMIDSLEMSPDEATRGMRQLVKDGFESVFVRHKVPEEERTTTRLFEMCDEMLDYQRDRDHYATLEELRLCDPSEVARLVTNDRHVEIFKRVFGRELSFQLLGDKAAKMRTKWVREDFGM